MQDALRRVATDASRLSDLTEELLALGALGSGVPAAGELAVRPRLEAAAGRARAQLGESARSVRIDLPEELRVRGGATLLDRALGNLVDNAVRHRAGKVTLSARSAAPGLVALAVHDEGTGLEADFLPHAAERFRRGERSRTGPRTGLGLALADAVASAYDGQLRICASAHHHRRPATDAALERASCRHPDTGTTVSIVLPAGA